MGEAVADNRVINASPEAVLSVVTDLEAYPEWQQEVREVEVLQRDAQGRPLQARMVVDARLFTASYTLAYTYSDTSMHWQLVSSEQLRQLDGGYTVTDNGDGTTTVSYELDADPTISVPRFMRRTAAEHIVRTALDGLKQRVETAR